MRFSCFAFEEPTRLTVEIIWVYGIDHRKDLLLRVHRYDIIKRERESMTSIGTFPCRQDDFEHRQSYNVTVRTTRSNLMN